MKIEKLILITTSILLFCSCGKDTGMRITTNTFANKEIIPKGFEKGASFSIKAKQKGDPLFVQEVSQKIATLLKENGFKVKENNADYKLNFSFAMEKSTHTRDVPVYIPDYGPWYYYDYYPYYRYRYRVVYVPEQYTLFNKILLIEVYEKGFWKNKPIWQGIAHSYEEDSDLRDAIDYLLVTVFKYFGKNTPKRIRSKIEENDSNVNKLRQDYFKPIN
ncbi:DUF4136 domain-containing protein [Candidatus Dependentiae bacterium]|nr:DUF4136 domain-containing protein [Candidatus Dependentiae bacterium]